MSESAVNRTIFPCPVCEETFASPEELNLQGETHDPEPTYQYYVHEAGYVMDFMENPATWTFVNANDDHICNPYCPLCGALGHSNVEPST
ncbi:hypothetical protein D6D01_09328 [Aureobasidium pullulans]|uniref:C2H2-type domain-containing protein n=1 Tax=Aureobasidium pullulans TaxID=5580 RepID=A0A4V4JRK4_AURPU|nr:hypothetical protein D6D01_09328 [Aureobasidium pullulans]